jgi:hypothetical protein
LIAPDSANSGGYLDIYLTTGPDVHVASNGDSNLILGRDDYANVTVNLNGNVSIQAITGNIAQIWTFGNDGKVTLPSLNAPIPRSYTNLGFTYGSATIDFTLNADGTFTNVSCSNGGGGYPYGPGVDPVVIMPGNQLLGGTTPANDIYWEYSEALSDGVITGFTYRSGTPPTYYIAIQSGLDIGISADNNNWVFGSDGEFYLPTGGRIGSTKGGTMLDGGAGNSVSLTSFYANGFYAGCFTANPDGNVYITTYPGSGSYSWNFDNTGNLSASGNIIALGNVYSNNISATGTANVYAVNVNQGVTWPGASTIYEDTNLVLQGNVAVSLTSPGTTQITANTYSWNFDNAGTLTLPGEGVIRSNNDTIVLQSWDTGNSIGYGLRVGTSGGLYLEQGSDPAWLTFNPNAGNAEITAALGTGGGAGKNLTLTAGAAATDTFNSNAGGNLNIIAGLGGFADGGGGGPGGNVNITAGAPGEITGVYGNVTINAGVNTWNFDNTGNITVPGAILTNSNSQLQLTESANTAYLGTTADDSTALYLTATTAQLYANAGVTIGSNVGGGNAHGWAFDVDGNINIPGDIISFGNISITTNVGNTTSSWTFDITGNLTLPGNTFSVNYANGTQVSIGGNYSNSNVATYLSSGNVSTDYLTTSVVSAQGNVRGGNINTIGLVTATGNVYGANFIGNVIGNLISTPTYGSFYDTTTQTNSNVGNAIPVRYNSTDINNGVTIAGAGNTQITISDTGLYNIQFSAQIAKTSGGANDIYIWLDKNGTAVPNSATALYLTGNNAKSVAAWNFVVDATAGDYYRLMWLAPSADVEILAQTAAGAVPAIPSVILTVVPVGA